MYPEDSLVKVFYQPGNPNEATLEKGIHSGEDEHFMFAAVLMFVYGSIFPGFTIFYCYRWRIERNKLRRNINLKIRKCY